MIGSLKISSKHVQPYKRGKCSVPAKSAPSRLRKEGGRGGKERERGSAQGGGGRGEGKGKWVGQEVDRWEPEDEADEQAGKSVNPREKGGRGVGEKASGKLALLA